MVKNPSLFVDPNIEYPPDSSSLSFDTYIQQCKKIISETRLDLTDITTREKIIEANAPFELWPSTPHKKIKYGVLLIHGLFETPLQMKDIGIHLQSQGFLVRAVLLPGHGTIPGALLRVDYHQWVKTVNFGYNKLAEDVEKIFIVGNSTGANLALYQAMHDNKKISGMVLLSPAFKIHSPLAPIAYLPTYLPWKRAAWLHQNANETIDYAKYRSIPFDAVYQVHQLSLKIKESHRHDVVACPLFFALSANDIIVTPQTTLNFFKAHLNPKSRLVLYTASLNPPTDPRMIIRQSVYPALRIRHFSHISIPISPENPHYGKNGDFAFASHVDNKANPIIYGEFNALQINLNHFLFSYHLAPVLYERLTFNPDFYNLMDMMDRFIKDV